MFKNKEKAREYVSKWSAANYGKILGYQAKYRRKHREEINSRRRESYPRYYAENREKILVKNRKYLEMNREKVNRKHAKTGRVYHFQKHYGITLADRKALWIRQTKRCAGCLLPLKLKDAHMDHDHETEQNRGLLHGTCNRALGLVKDFPETLRDLASYLEKTK